MPCVLLVLLLFACAEPAAGEGKDYRWPSGYEGKQRLAVERLDPSTDGATAYQTEGYRYFAEVEIPNEDWRSIMIVCEGLRGALRSLPLDLVRHDQAGGRRGIVRLFPDEAAYHAAGGLEATVGTFRPRGGEVLIWTRGLNEPDPEQGGFRLAKARQYDLLVSRAVTPGNRTRNSPPPGVVLGRARRVPGRGPVRPRQGPRSRPRRIRSRRM